MMEEVTGRLGIIHLMPKEEMGQHQATVECTCQPAVREGVVVHQSLHRSEGLIENEHD